MAKVAGPLMSMEASGKYGNALVFSKWKGRPTVRLLVTPSNPMSTNQVNARNRMRVTGEIQRFVSRCVEHQSGQTLTPKAFLQGKAPSGQAWNGYLVQTIIGPSGASYTAARTAFAALTSSEKTTWESAAGNLHPPTQPVNTYIAGNQVGPTITRGEIYFIMQYALSRAGYGPTPSGVPQPYIA